MLYDVLIVMFLSLVNIIMGYAPHLYHIYTHLCSTIMNISQRNLVALSSLFVVILIIMNFKVTNVQGSDQVHFTHEGMKGKNRKFVEIFVAKSGEVEKENNFIIGIKGHRKLSSTSTDGDVSHHRENVGEYCKFLKSIGKSCPN